MIRELRATTWEEANQAYLSSELARIRAAVDAAGDAKRASAIPGQLPGAARGREMMADASIEVLTRTFGLSHFERDVLLLCAGVEMDSTIARSCAAANGRSGVGYATFGLALGALSEPHWSALSPTGPLRHWPLVTLADGQPLTSAPLRIDERILFYLAGLDELDPDLVPLLRTVPPATAMAAAHAAASEAIARSWADSTDMWAVIQLHGDDRDGQEDVAGRAATLAGLVLHVLGAEEIPAHAQERGALAALWTREALLLGSALLVEAAPDVPNRLIVDFVDRVRGPVIVAAREPMALRFESRRYAIDRPNPLEQRRLWTTVFRPTSEAAARTLDLVAGQFRLSARRIVEAGPVLADAGDDLDTRKFLSATRHAIGNAELDDLAERVEPVATWADLVLPDDRISVLREIAGQVRNRTMVHETWGLAHRETRGLGITALFAGESGTGKTMAAEVLSAEIGLDLYRIDLSTIVSKYIGETEKNLRRVFDAADHSGVILLFDEADALFGKRSEVKDSHDRYANIEVSYLLQKMESYRGLAILTTNAKSALDRSFQRRLRFVVQFPFPDAVYRERIWRSAIPAPTPTARLDFAKLSRLSLSGGSIRNIVLLAAFRAAGAGSRVTMADLASAARTELAKSEKVVPDAQTRDWA